MGKSIGMSPTSPVRRFLAIAAVAAWSGCGGGGGGGHTVAPVTPVVNANATPAAGSGSASVTLRITVPSASTTTQAHRGPTYISPSTQSMSIAVNAGTATIVNLTPGSPNCVQPASAALSCSATVGAPVGTDTFLVTLYDGTNGAGNVLATKTLAQPVLANATNTVALVLNGVVVSIGIAAGATGVPAGRATSLPLTVNAYDAQNNVIVGPGNYADANGNALTITLSAVQAAPAVQTPYVAGAATLSATTLTNPSAPLTISYDGHALLSTQFTATVSGGAAVQPATATLTFTPTVYEYPAAVANGGPYSLAVGPDKQIWVTLFGLPGVEHFAAPAPGAASLAATSVAIPDVDQDNDEFALGIAAVSDGNMWIASWGNELYVCPLLGNCASFRVVNPNHPEYVIDGGDGNVYVNQSYFSGPYRYAISSRSLVHDFGIGGGHRENIGPDGRIWSAGGQQGCCNAPYIVALPTLTSANQAVTLVAMPTDTTNVAVGPDGNIWYVQSTAGVVGHLTSLTAVAPTGITINVPSGPGLRAIIAGPDGNMYFTEPTANKIARAITSATTVAGITEFPVTTPAAGLIDLLSGPDGNVWFVENAANKIGELAL
jgi:hypothetical protein